MGLLSCETVKSMSNKYVRDSDKNTKNGLTQSLLKTAAVSCESNITIRKVEEKMQDKSIFGHTDDIVIGIGLKNIEK